MSTILQKFSVVTLAIFAGSVLLTGVALAEEIKKMDVEGVVFPESQELILDLPAGWGVEKATTMGGSIEITNYYFFDEQDKLAFKLNYPVREIGYETTTAKNQRTLLIEAGVKLSVIDRILNDDSSTGFVHYTWTGEDFWQDSFEIFIPFREELYARTATEQQTGGVETKYKSYQEYKKDQRSYSNSMDKVIASIAKVSSVEGPSDNDADNANYMIESGTVTVYVGDKKIVADLQFGLRDSMVVTTTFNTKASVLDDVLAAVKERGRNAGYVDQDKIQITYTNNSYEAQGNSSEDEIKTLRARLNQLIALLQQILQLRALLGQ